MKKRSLPIISVCIPVFNTERYLEGCLTSVLNQDFSDFEIIVVSDCSKGKDECGRDCKKIIKQVQKSTSIPINFIQHSKNRGILEVRRTAYFAAVGKYITYVDSDDILTPNALSSLYNACVQSGADIVHGTSVGGTFDENLEFTPSKQNRYSLITYETFENEQIIKEWLVGQKFTANVWGKLIARELYEKAFAEIPYTTCNLAEDYLMFFFLAVNAKKYVGIKDKVYLYREEGGMSSRRTIDTLHQWTLICSSASVFSIISTWLNDNKTESSELPIDSDVVDVIKRSTQYYLANNLMCFSNSVADSIKPEAYSMLCDFWGEHFVKKTEQMLVEQTKKEVTRK